MAVAKKICGYWLPGLAVFCLAPLASAADFPLEVACTAWSPESAAQVEARVRANLLAEGLQAGRVQISCLGAEVNVTVQAAAGVLTRPIQSSSPSLEDDVVAGVEAALRELAAPSVDGARAEVAPSATLAAPHSAPAVVEPRPGPRSPAPTLPAAQTAAQLIELGLTPELNRFSEHAAIGASLGLDIGSERLRYGIALGGHSVLGLPPSFAAAEAHAGARIALRLHEVAGLSVSLGLGASLLVASPSPNVQPRSSTSLSAAFLDLELSRPFWLGRFGLAPVVGVRVFSAVRNVRVNETEQLRLPVAIPKAGLSLLYRLH